MATRSSTKKPTKKKDTVLSDVKYYWGGDIEGAVSGSYGWDTEAEALADLEACLEDGDVDGEEYRIFEVRGVKCYKSKVTISLEEVK
jgi:hypothetical protein